MTESPSKSALPDDVAAIAACGYACWAGSAGDKNLRKKFDSKRIPVVGVRHVRIWGLQVDDERALPGRERTSTPDEDLWEINLRAKNGSTYEVDARLLQPASDD